MWTLAILFAILFALIEGGYLIMTINQIAALIVMLYLVTMRPPITKQGETLFVILLVGTLIWFFIAFFSDEPWLQVSRS
jgi:hypothetical protein